MTAKGVRAVGNHAIDVDFRFKGQRYRERLRLSPTAANLRYVRNLKATIETEIAKGVFDYAKHFPESKRALTVSPRGAAQALTVGQWVERFVEGRRGKVELETYKDHKEFAKVLARVWPDKKLRDLTRTDIETWIGTTPLSAKRITNIMSPLRQALNLAAADGLIDKNPVAGLRVRRKGGGTGKKRPPDPLTPEELEALSKVYLGPLWTFWVWTGLRTGELMALTGSDVLGDRLCVDEAVVVGRTKSTKTTNSDRVIALLPAAKAALPTVGPAEPVWTNPNTGRRFREDRELQRAFRRACAEARVRYRAPYNCRHTFASWALMAGEPVGWVAEQMGHKDKTMVLKIYARWIPSMDPMAGSRMVKILAGGAAK